MNRLTFSLRPVPPFRLEFTAWVLRRRPDNVVDRWEDQSYRRALLVEGHPAEVAVVQLGPPEDPLLQVQLEGDQLGHGAEEAATMALEKLLGLRIDLAPFYLLAAGDPQLGPLVERFRGLKPPRFPTLFETLVNAIACQQITLTLGIRLLGRLAESYGVAAHSSRGITHAFPRPIDLAGVDPEALRQIGLSRQKAVALVEISSDAAHGELDLERMEALDTPTAVERLLQLRGVGRWSAEYVLLRGMGRLELFPGDDVGARNNLQRWLGLTERLDYQGVRRMLLRWHPYAGLVYFHLLLDRLDSLGLLP